MFETTKQIQDVRVVASVPHLSNWLSSSVNTDEAKHVVKAKAHTDPKIWQLEASNSHEDH